MDNEYPFAALFSTSMFISGGAITFLIAEGVIGNIWIHLFPASISLYNQVVLMIINILQYITGIVLTVISGFNQDTEDLFALRIGGAISHCLLDIF
ncbi:MAG: hypothetical protein EZS28_023189 [Streblomastix strix]|uniref:Uncharacterized protein n=1 Tax=Streblomastix strix TaxID=222440 RepID=A0A5J4VFM1_9EUKA|nr:MAG: hypothetical protein EZS28_023189 [Streblomastix strix]